MNDGIWTNLSRRSGVKVSEVFDVSHSIATIPVVYEALLHPDPLFHAGLPHIVEGTKMVVFVGAASVTSWVTAVVGEKFVHIVL